MTDNKKQLLSMLCSLLLVLCFLSCENPLSSADNLPIPAGQGTFTLMLGTARTVLPDTPSLNDFAVYNLDFEPISGGSPENADRTNKTLLTDPVFLEIGIYNLVVNAYKDSDKNQLMARGTLNGIVIHPGKNTAASVTLKTLLAGGAGTFRWEVTFPADVTAHMTITPGNAGGTAQETVTLISPHASGSRALNSGPYNVTFNLEKTDREPVVWEELLYVYQNLESVFSFEFKDAYFNDSVYTVTYQYNDGVTSNQNKSVLHGDTLARPATPYRSGYAFAGWYADNGAFAHAGDFDSPVIDSFTLYAKWVEQAEPGPVTVRELTVMMRDSYGDGWNNAVLRISISNIDGTFRSTSATIATVSSQGFYQFTVNSDETVRFYWTKGSKDSECAFAVYNSNNPPSQAFNPANGAAVDTARILFYKQYFNLDKVADGDELGFIPGISTGGTPAVSFDANGGSGAVPNAQTVTAGSSVTLPDAGGMTKSAYTFGGWNTDASGTGTDLYPGMSYTPTGNTTLYARWAISLTENIWADGNIISNASGSNLWYSFNVAKGTTYYVWWNDSKHGNSTRTLDIAVNAVYSDGSSIFTGVDSGYESPQSFTANRSGAVHIKAAPYYSGRTGTFAVVYSAGSARPDFYTVTFNGNNGTGTIPASRIVSAGSSTIIPDESGLSRSNFISDGWNTKSDGTGDNYSGEESFTPAADTTLYVKWIPLYTVTFNADGGTGAVPSPITRIVAGTSIILPDGSGLTLFGRTYVGWRDSTNAAYRPGASYTPPGNVTLYARWLYDYDVKFDANGGSGTVPATITVPGGSSMLVPDGSGLTKDGYVFAGWSSRNNGTGGNYYPGRSFSSTPTSLYTTYTLYANWSKPLSNNSWAEGSVSYSGGPIYDWHSFSVVSGRTYYIWWNDGWGNNTYFSYVNMDAYYHDGTIIFRDANHKYITPQTFTADRDSMVHLRSAPYNNNAASYGSFAIMYNANYTVTFDANDGSGEAPSPVTVLGGSSITLPNENSLTRDGYVFGGWNTGDSGTGTDLYPGASYTPTDSITLYARWDIPLTQNIWTDGSIVSTAAGSGVWYSFNVINGTTYSVWWNDGKQGNAAKTLDVAVSAVYRDGSTIFTGVDSGWTTSQQFTANGSGTVHVKAAPFNSGGAGTFAIAYNAGSAKPDLYTVTFNANDGSGEVPLPIGVNPGSGVTLPNGSGLSRSGYAFGGWNTLANGAGAAYQPGATLIPSADTALYAQWIPLYTVTFDSNYGSGTAPSSQTVQKDTSIMLPGGGGLTRSGYLFGGWNANASGTGNSYYPGASYTPTSNTTLYARWDTSLTENTWADGSASGSGAWYSFRITSGTTYYLWWNDQKEGNALKTLDIAVSAVYSDGSNCFSSVDSGWTTPHQFTADRSGTVHVRVAPYISNRTGTFALVYSTSNTKPAAYTVAYNVNGGSGSVSSRTVRAGSSITLSNGSGLTRSGYLFGGWNTDASGTGTNYSASSSYTPTADITLYAKWNPSCTVTFNANGGRNTPSPIITEIGSRITLPNDYGMTRDGYLFGGWNTNSSGTGNNYNASAYYTPTGDVTLYAKWNPAYTVTFNANGGGSAPSPIAVVVGSPITLPAGPARSNWTFTGWNTNASGDGTNYSAGSSYLPDRNVTLYARWTCTVTFSNGGHGTVSDLSQTVVAGSSITLPSGSNLTPPRPAGYVFNGWNTNIYGTGTNYDAGATYTPSGNITLYANWLTYTVTFNLNGGVGTVPAEQNVTPGSNITLPSNAAFTRLNYTFDGWNTKSDGTGTQYNALASFKPVSSVTLYARWSDIAPNIWHNGSLSTGGISYSFNVTTGTTYYIWMNDYSNGDGTKTGDMMISVSYRDGTSICTNVGNAWYPPISFIAQENGPITIRVQQYGNGYPSGTYAIAYSTSNSMPPR